ncbi:MAG TPA: hypothetical protein VGD77_02670 [Gemmatimonadaceae bacterium]
MAAPLALSDARTDYRSVLRRLAAQQPAGAAGVEGESLERSVMASEPARLVKAIPLEGSTLRAHQVEGDPEVGFDAFLDGTQSSRALDYVDGVAVVHGTAAAVIRARRNRRMTTWGTPLVVSAIYAPQRALPPRYWEGLHALGVEVVDTSPAPGDSLHPFSLRDAAVHRVQKDRERLEQQLAERWCASERGRLFIDGGISGSERVAVSACTVGVVKSHRSLYAEGEELARVFALRRGERSSVVRITSSKRTTVASWYLRLRDPAGHDPMWGLVRVEVAEPASAAELAAIGARADEISRYVLAEAAPVALPDARWHNMAYGIRDCEEFLRAIL